MSFKDDFFEALRSVKRDFMRDPDAASGGSRNAGAADNAWEASSQTGDSVSSGSFANSGGDDSSSVQPKSPEDTGDFRMPDNIVTPDDEAPSYMSDREVMDAFEQASFVEDGDVDEDDTVGRVHTLGGNDPTYREYAPTSASDSPSSGQSPKLPEIEEYPPSGDGRKVFDFDAGDLYTDDKTVISRNTLIRGNLQTEDSVRLLGSIMGDIDCKSNIVVAGKVRGNTSAANAYIVDAQIDGDMVCDDAVNINKDAWILGNIRAQQAEIDGKIKGNIEIRHAVSIGSASSVIGNISTDELEIKRGAFVNGQIIMYSPSRDVIDRFDTFDRN